MSRKSKKYNEAAKLVDRTKLYDVEEAMELLEKTHHVNFDETVEVHVRLGEIGRAHV